MYAWPTPCTANCRKYSTCSTSEVCEVPTTLGQAGTRLCAARKELAVSVAVGPGAGRLDRSGVRTKYASRGGDLVVLVTLKTKPVPENDPRPPGPEDACRREAPTEAANWSAAELARSVYRETGALVPWTLNWRAHSRWAGPK